MLKEQGRLAAAELQYRTAWALGETSADLRRHLRFVCEAQGARFTEPRIATGSVPLRRSPTLMDLEALAYLFWGEPADFEDDLLRLMRHCATCEAAALEMIADPRFARANRLFLRLMGDLL
jgi:hypothetical protein